MLSRLNAPKLRVQPRRCVSGQKRLLLPLALTRAGIFAVLVLAPHASFASPTFPAELEKAAQLDCTPACISCHTTEPGVSGSANQPFADAMQANGLTAGKPDTLAPAYAAVLVEQSTLPPEEQLDLNFPCEADILYGCGAHIAPEAPSPIWPWLFASSVLAVLVTTRRWRRRSRSS